MASRKPLVLNAGQMQQIQSADVVDLTTLQALVAAGVSHKAGYAPDPGATAHSNAPYRLGDDAAWHAPLGHILGTKAVATDESTTSTTAVDLTTVDSVTFTLDVGQTVLTLYFSNTYLSAGAAGENCSTMLEYDGSLDGGTQYDAAAFDLSKGVAGLCYGLKALGAGGHTVKAKHFVPNGGTGHWRARLLICILAG